MFHPLGLGNRTVARVAQPLLDVMLKLRLGKHKGGGFDYLSAQAGSSVAEHPPGKVVGSSPTLSSTFHYPGVVSVSDRIVLRVGIFRTLTVLCVT